MSLHDQYPKGYDAELGEYICEKIATTDLGVEHILGEYLAEHGKGPSLRTVWSWLKSTSDFKTQYDLAREMQADLITDRACIEARTSRVGTIVEEGTDFKGKPYTKTRTTDNVERSKLIVYTLNQRAKQLAPKRYGEKASVEVSGPGGGSIPVSLEIDL